MEQNFSKKYDWVVDYFRISGRITRRQYILRLLGRYVFLFLAFFVFFFTTPYLNSFFEFIDSLPPVFSAFFDGVIGLLFIVFLVLYIIFMLAQEIKRLHDINYSGWYLLIGFIPFIAFIYYIILIFKDGTIGPNKYGPDPKNRIVDAEN